MKEIWFGIAYGRILLMFDRVQLSAYDTIMTGYYRLTFFSFFLKLGAPLVEFDIDSI